MMLNKNDYLVAINGFIDYMKNEDIENRIVAMYLGGSVARGDFSPGRSDIDIYIITNFEDTELENKLLTKAIEISDLHLGELKKTCDNPFTVAFTTIDSIKNGSSWLGIGPEYYSFVENSKLLFGKDVRYLIPTPSIELIKQISIQATQALLTGIQEMPEPTIEECNKDYITKGMFEMIFSSMHFMLSNIGIYERGKMQMVADFQKVCTDAGLKEICLHTKDLWNQFETRSFDDVEIKKLIDEGKKFLSLGYNEFFINQPYIT